MAENVYEPEFLVYNTFGLHPVESVFQIDCKMFTDIVRRIASEKISGIEDVTLQNDRGAVGLFIWFNGNSDHFTDSRTENTAIRTKLNRLSKEMKEFLEKFGWNEADEDPRNGDAKVHHNEIIRRNDNPEIKGKYVAVHAAINPFLMILFDGQGNAFRREYNKNIPKARIRREWVWDDPKKKTHLTGIRVSKFITNPALSRRDLHAKWSGKFN